MGRLGVRRCGSRTRKAQIQNTLTIVHTYRVCLGINEKLLFFHITTFLYIHTYIHTSSWVLAGNEVLLVKYQVKIEEKCAAVSDLFSQELWEWNIFHFFLHDFIKARMTDAVSPVMNLTSFRSSYWISAVNNTKKHWSQQDQRQTTGVWLVLLHVVVVAKQKMFSGRRKKKVKTIKYIKLRHFNLLQNSTC